jgi:hypothetical protein
MARYPTTIEDAGVVNKLKGEACNRSIGELMDTLERPTVNLEREETLRSIQKFYG